MKLIEQTKLQNHAVRLSAGILGAILMVSGIAACGSSSNDAGASKPSASSSASLGEAAKRVPESLKNKTIKVAVLNDYPPLGFVNDGALAGTGPDLTKAIADDTGLKLEVQVSTATAMIPGLQSNRYDVINAQFQVTDERRKTLDFVTMATSGTAFVVRADSGFTVNSTADLCGRTSATLQGSAEHTKLEDLSKQCQSNGKQAIDIKAFTSNNEGGLALKSSRVDVFTLGAAASSDLVRTSDGKFVLAPFTYAQTLGAIAFPKGSEIAPIFHQAIQDLIANGKYKEIMEKYSMGKFTIPSSELLQ